MRDFFVSISKIEGERFRFNLDSLGYNFVEGGGVRVEVFSSVLRLVGRGTMLLAVLVAVLVAVSKKLREEDDDK